MRQANTELRARTQQGRTAPRQASPIQGRRLLRLIEDHLRHLHDLPAHGNRTLRHDHIVVAHLIAFFNPTVNSLRTIEDVCAHPRVRRLFRLPRVPRSTLSDAQRLFDPALLEPILAHLAQQAVQRPHDARLDALTQQILAVDATFFEVAGRIAWAVPHNSSSSRGCVQLCLHFDVLHGAPTGFTLIEGAASERSELPAAIRSGCLYLLDRAYQSYGHLDQIVAAQSDFVVRLRRSANFELRECRPLTVQDRLAHVQRDWTVQPADRHYRTRTPLRLVEISIPGESEPVRLLTNRMDLPAELIGILYRHRWQIELFFRWLKCVVQLTRFTSESAGGMTLQLYVALIGTLLIALETGQRPTKYDYLQMTLAAAGLVSLEQALAVAAKRRAERARAAAWQREYQARRRTQKNR